MATIYMNNLLKNDVYHLKNCTFIKNKSKMNAGAIHFNFFIMTDKDVIIE